MKNRANRAAAEIIGAVVGAGFASGKEIASFFTRFGAWGWAGVAAAAATVAMVGLGVMRSGGAAGMPRAWQGAWMGKLWRGAFALLMMATGGAMLAAAGEIAALMLPLHGARGIGLVLTIALAWLLAGREQKLLPAVSRMLILCLLAVMLAGLFLPAGTAAAVEAEKRWYHKAAGILYGLSYGGFNVALAAPMLSILGCDMDAGEKRRCALTTGLILALLLGCGNAVLLRHTALRGETLPFIRLLNNLGQTGYLLGGTALYLAVLTTLTAALRGLTALLPAKSAWQAGGAALVLLMALGGFESMVDVVYPFLGGGCFLLLVAALGASRRQK